MRSRNFVIFAGAVAAVLILALLLRQPVTQRVVPDDQNIIVAKSDYHLSETHVNDLVVMGSSSVVIDQNRTFVSAMETRVTGVEKSVRRRLWLTAGLQSGVRLALAFLSFR